MVTVEGVPVGTASEELRPLGVEERPLVQVDQQDLSVTAVSLLQLMKSLEEEDGMEEELDMWEVEEEDRVTAALAQDPMPQESSRVGPQVPHAPEVQS